jgi:glycine/D-amino acid oxidase-like deaminating enzyme
MTDTNANVVICGAGIAGVSTAYYLAQRGIDGILLVDQSAPLSLTSDKSTEAYRNWWPGPDAAMVALMNHSIDLIENFAAESNNIFHLNRRGYLYATADRGRISDLINIAERAEIQGAGQMRIHRGNHDDPVYLPHNADGYIDLPDGCDLILDPEMIQKHFPYLSNSTVALLHTRRCGWFSGQQFGMHLFEKATQGGVRYVNARVEGVNLAGDRISQIHVNQNGTTFNIATKFFVNAAGPHLQQVCDLLGIKLPVYCERHLKVSIKDIDEVIPRDAPLLIWDDSQRLSWDKEEEQFLSDSDEDRMLLEELPPGAHMRPEGGIDSQNILLLWPYHMEKVHPIFPVPIPPSYPEVALRGLIAMIPGLNAYLRRMPKPFIDGGYYTKTPENRLLASPLPIQGSYILGALSGYGLMAACGAAELLAAHISQSDLPTYADAFMLERYQDPNYLRAFEEWEHSGQL